MVRRYAMAGQRADRPLLESLAAEGRCEGEDADDLPGWRTGSPRAAAAISGDVSCAQVERRADTLICGTPRGPRLAGAPASAGQAADRDGVVREVRQQPRLQVGACARRREEGDAQADHGAATMMLANAPRLDSPRFAMVQTATF